MGSLAGPQRSRAADAVTDRCDSGFLRVYSGEQPANADAPVGTAVLLIEWDLASPAFSTAVNGVAQILSVSPSVAVAGGTPTFFRLFESNGVTAVADGTAGFGSGELIIRDPGDPTATGVVAGRSYPLTSFFYNQTGTTGEGGAAPPPAEEAVLPLSGFGTNFERNYSIANGFLDGVPLTTVQRFTERANWVRIFLYQTLAVGHGPRLAPVWPANPMLDAEFVRLINTIDRIVGEGRVVWYCFVPGPYNVDPPASQEPTELDPAAFQAYLAAGSAWFAARYTPEQMVLAPWNETWSGSSVTVNALIATSYTTMRAAAPEHWIGFSGPEYGKIWRLAEVTKPAGATKIFFDIHDYEVTREGDANWYGRAHFINDPTAGQVARLGAPIVFGEIDLMAPASVGGPYPYTYWQRDYRRIRELKAFAADMGNIPHGLWTVCSNIARNANIEHPFPSTAAGFTNDNWWPQLEAEMADDIYPRNLTVPTISGIAAQGQLLTASPGTWEADPPEALTYQWQRGTSNISGATSSTYVVQAGDVGSTIRVTVKATNIWSATTNTWETNTAASANTAVVTGSPTLPVNTVLPTINDVTPNVGQVLQVASPGTWTGTVPMTFTYQWQRGTTNISGATAANYQAVIGDLGATLRVIVTATNTVGNASATSASTAAVAAAPSGTEQLTSIDWTIGVTA